MRQMMARLKLTVNEEKTRICHLPDGEFDFLGYTLSALLIQNREGLYSYSAIEEEYKTHDRIGAYPD